MKANVRGSGVNNLLSLKRKSLLILRVCGTVFPNLRSCMILATIQFTVGYINSLPLTRKDSEL